jgi:hypothetical protein
MVNPEAYKEIENSLKFFSPSMETFPSFFFLSPFHLPSFSLPFLGSAKIIQAVTCYHFHGTFHVEGKGSGVDEKGCRGSGIGDGGLGIGDWGLGIGEWGLGIEDRR